MQSSKTQKPPGKSLLNTAPRFTRQTFSLAQVFNPAPLLLSKGGKNENKIFTKYFNYGEFAVIGGAL